MNNATFRGFVSELEKIATKAIILKHEKALRATHSSEWDPYSSKHRDQTLQLAYWFDRHPEAKLEKKAGILHNVGTRIAHTLKPAGELIQKGWNTGGNKSGFAPGWFGAGKEGKGIYESVTSLGGLTSHLPVGPKSMTVGFGALGARDALKKEDESGQGRSRDERVGSLVGGTAAGIAGGAMGLPGAIVTGIAGDYAGSRIGRAIQGRTPTPAVPQVPVPKAPVTGKVPN